MKKLILLAVILMSSLKGISQENKNHIKVTGVNKVAITPVYIAKMMVSLNNVYYDTQITSLDEIKTSYLDKLAKAGIKNSSIKKDQLQYDLMGYEKNGIIIEFQGTSLEELQKFLKVRSLGVSKIDYRYNAEFTEEQMAEYAKGAFESAKKKAEAIAKKLGKKIGPIVSFTDNNTNKIDQSWYMGTPTDVMDYHISVSFQLL